MSAPAILLAAVPLVPLGLALCCLSSWFRARALALLVLAPLPALAAAILAEGLQTPILVRPDGDRFVLVEGLHRLEAARSLGETTIAGYRVSARKH